MDLIPPTHPISARHTTKAELTLRYEDITQDGRLRLTTMPECLARTVWGKLIGPSKLFGQLTAQGIAPLLTRLVIEGGDGPISVAHPLQAIGRFRFAHSLDDDAEVQRIVLNMWGELNGPRASVRDPQPEGRGETINVGRIFAEHTLSRPFAAKGERKVRRLDGITGISPYPKANYLGESPRGLLALPRGSEALEPLTADPQPVVFGVDDTDSNQHVNSLAYPGVFRAAALRRFAQAGQSPKLMLRTLEIGFRKPSFAGESLHVHVRQFRYRSRVGAICTLGAEDPDQSPRCIARMYFTP